VNVFDDVHLVLERELQRRLQCQDVRLVALVDIGEDDVLRDRLADACAGVRQPFVAVFEAKEREG
jgi:hypothetical protein